MNKKITLILLLFSFMFAENDIQKTYRLIYQLKFLKKLGINPSYHNTLEISSIKDKRAISALTDYLDVCPAEMRHFTLIKLGDLKAYIAAHKIIDLASSDYNWWVRSVAVETLGKLETTSVIPAILKALDDKNKFVSNMALTQLNILKQKEILDIEDKDSQEPHSLLFWQKHKADLSTRYKMNEKIPNFTYYEPLHSFSFIRPVKAKCYGHIQKDGSISYTVSIKKKDYDVWIDAEADTEIKADAEIEVKNKKGNIETESYKKILNKLKEKKAKNLKEFNSSQWKPYKKMQWPAYQIRYTGKYKSDIVYFHALIAIHHQKKIYTLEAAIPKKDKAMGLKFFFNIVKNFHIENK